MRAPALLLTLVVLTACGAQPAAPLPARPQLQQPPSGPATSPSVSGMATCGLAPNERVADPGGVHGIFVLVPSAGEAATAVDQYLLRNPDLCGANFWVRWNQVEPSRGRYDWSTVEASAAPWKKAGKLVNLIFIGAAQGTSTTQGATPPWVQSQVQMITCTGQTQPTPVFWQAGYEDSWKAFIRAATDHFASDSSLGYMRFGLGIGGEDLVGPADRPGACQQLWNAAGYQQQWSAYNAGMVAYLGSLHSSKQLMIGINPFNGSAELAQSNVKAAAGAGIGFGMQGLAGPDVSAIAQNQACVDADWCHLFQQYAGRVPLEVQTLAVSNPAGGPVQKGIPGTRPGSSESQLTGPLPPLLSAALSVHAQVFELYAEDLLIAFDPAWPGYQQYHAEYGKAIAALAAQVGTSGGVNPAG